MKNWRLLRVTAVLVTLILSLTMSAAALDGQVVYAQGAEKFFFLPGTTYSPTDLFPNFKDVMPGDTIEQRILVKNDISNDCKVKVYMRALGAHEDSVEFLSQLKLTVTKETDTALFEAAADQTAQLTDWVYLGTLYSGGECELIATLEVPVTLDNQFKKLVGYLDWEFAVEELPVEPSDPKPPATGDNSRMLLWAGLLAGSVSALILVPVMARHKKTDE